MDKQSIILYKFLDLLPIGIKQTMKNAVELHPYGFKIDYLMAFLKGLDFWN